MVSRIIYLFTFILLFSSCNSQQNSVFASADPIQIKRFDKALFELINAQNTTLRQQLLQEYPEMLELTGKAILNMHSVETAGFFDRIENYYSEPTLFGLYQDAIQVYDTIGGIEKQLGQGFAYLQSIFPEMSLPDVYMHVSGLNQNVLVSEDILSISIDKYMGKQYPLYLDFFYDYQLEKMQTSYIVPDYLAGWIMSEYPFEGKETILLERMIYEGKIKYLISQAFPEKTPAQIMGYRESDEKWCESHEKDLWKMIIERKHLYTPDRLTTERYFEDIPANFLSTDAPGNIGTWIGWQIVKKYMKETQTTPKKLMQQNDAQEILTISKYK